MELNNPSRMHNAAFHGDVDEINFLLNSNISANKRNDKGNTPLVSAIAGNCSNKRKLKVITILVNGGADVNAMNKDGSTLLHIIVDLSFRFQVSKKVVRLLIDYGIDRSITNNSGLTAAELAFESNNLKMGQLYLFYKPMATSTKRAKAASTDPIKKQVGFFPSNEMIVINGETGFMNSIMNYVCPKRCMKKEEVAGIETRRCKEPLIKNGECKINHKV